MYFLDYNRHLHQTGFRNSFKFLYSVSDKEGTYLRQNIFSGDMLCRGCVLAVVDVVTVAVVVITVAELLLLLL